MILSIKREWLHSGLKGKVLKSDLQSVQFCTLEFIREISGKKKTNQTKILFLDIWGHLFYSMQISTEVEILEFLDS